MIGSNGEHSITLASGTWHWHVETLPGTRFVWYSDPAQPRRRMYVSVRDGSTRITNDLAHILSHNVAVRWWLDGDGVEWRMHLAGPGTPYHQLLRAPNIVFECAMASTDTHSLGGYTQLEQTVLLGDLTDDEISDFFDDRSERPALRIRQKETPDL
jgi:hypothetical protein